MKTILVAGLALTIFVAIATNGGNASAAADDKRIVAGLDTQYQAAVRENDAATMDHDGGAAYTADADMPADDNSEASSGQQATIHANVTTPITPEIKSQIAEEVKGEIVNDNVEASNPSQSSFDVLPSVLSNPNHVFVVSTDLDSVSYTHLDVYKRQGSR